MGPAGFSFFEGDFQNAFFQSFAANPAGRRRPSHNSHIERMCMGLFGKGVARICAVVAASSAREMAAQLRRAWRETPTVELRLDWLNSDAERRSFLAWLRRNRPKRAVLLATCRRREGGGLFAGDVQDKLYWLAHPPHPRLFWRDLPLQTPPPLPP